MIKKRIIASIIIRNGYAVQSFGYERYLPLGTPEALVENLARWKVDEIVVTDIGCTKENYVINYELISKLAHISDGTPLIYSGGISSPLDAAKVIENGADRVVIENSFYTRKVTPKEIALEIGAQAIIMSIPVINKSKNLYFFDYLQRKSIELSEIQFLLNDDFISEFLITDVANEGAIDKSFQANLISNKFFKNLSLICNGGINSLDSCQNLLKNKLVKAIMIGNKLNHSELSYLQIKDNLPTKIQNFLRL